MHQYICSIVFRQKHLPVVEFFKSRYHVLLGCSGLTTKGKGMFKTINLIIRKELTTLLMIRLMVLNILFLKTVISVEPVFTE